MRTLLQLSWVLSWLSSEALFSGVSVRVPCVHSLTERTGRGTRETWGSCHVFTPALDPLAFKAWWPWTMNPLLVNTAHGVIGPLLYS